MYIMALSLIANIACGKKENNPQKQNQTSSKQIQKVDNNFKYPLFDTYRIGEKFKNRGYEGKELKQLTPFTYGTILDNQGITKILIITTAQGTIAGINKSYELNGSLRDFVKIFENKLNIKFKGKGVGDVIPFYVYDDGKTRVIIDATNQNRAVWVRELNDYTGIVDFIIENTKLMDQAEKDMNDLEKKQEAEKIKKAADNFKI